MPNGLGGAVSFSTSSRRTASCSLVSSSAAPSFSFWERAWGQVLFGLEQTFFEDPHSPRRVLETTAQNGDLLLEHLDRPAQLNGLSGVVATG